MESLVSTVSLYIVFLSVVKYIEANSSQVVIN